MRDFYTEMSRQMVLDILFPVDGDEYPLDWERLAAQVEAVNYLEACLHL